MLRQHRTSSDCGFMWKPWLEPIPAKHRSTIATWAAEHPSSLLGEAIRLIRECLGLTRGELASLLGVKPGRVGMWERGTAKLEPIYERELRKLYLSDKGAARSASAQDISEYLEVTENWPQWVRFEERRFGWRAVRYGELQPDIEKAPRPKAKAPKLRLVKKAA